MDKPVSSEQIRKVFTQRLPHEDLWWGILQDTTPADRTPDDTADYAVSGIDTVSSYSLAGSHKIGRIR